MRLAIIMLAIGFLPGVAWPQTKKPPEKVWTAAPVPGALPSNPTPADRAGDTTSTDSTAPFSSRPLGAQMDSRPTDITQDGGGPGSDSTTPDLSR